MGTLLLSAIGLLLIGFILFLIEAMIPSFGIIGLLGSGCIIGAIWTAFVINKAAGVLFLVMGPAGALAVFLGGLKLLPRTKFGRGFILTGPADEREQTVETGLDILEGKEGVAQTMCRPSGIALIDGERITVQTEGEVIEKNMRIKVIKVSGNKVFVEKV